MPPAAMGVNFDDDIKIRSNGDGAVRLRQRESKR
ncbi:hypothetical protein GYH30_055678 [Glycine max]|nr:hypothetical protein GYH30_055678 [Glycine max]KHN42374.1 hypothetical protein glysoja_020086 [Glycine soja]